MEYVKVNIPKPTIERLKVLQHKGQTLAGVIEELLDRLPVTQSDYDTLKAQFAPAVKERRCIVCNIGEFDTADGISKDGYCFKCGIAYAVKLALEQPHTAHIEGITHTCSLDQIITGGCTPDCAGCAEEKRIREAIK